VVTGEWSADGDEWAIISEDRLPNLPSAVTVGPIVARLVEVQYTATLDEYDLSLLNKNEK
jgi:hypothetical protein